MWPNIFIELYLKGFSIGAMLEDHMLDSRLKEESKRGWSYCVELKGINVSFWVKPCGFKIFRV
jgi:hypothetical protein